MPQAAVRVRGTAVSRIGWRPVPAARTLHARSCSLERAILLVPERDPDDSDILDETLRGALFRMSDEDEAEPEPDVVDLAAGRTTDETAPDLTLGGYIELHKRVPAFEGSDGQPYTVDVDVEATDDADRPYAAFLLFVRWAATGAGIMDHVESRDIARGRTEEEARKAALELSLFEVKAELDAAIQRRKQELGE